MSDPSLPRCYCPNRYESGVGLDPITHDDTTMFPNYDSADLACRHQICCYLNILSGRGVHRALEAPVYSASQTPLGIAVGDDDDDEDEKGEDDEEDDDVEYSDEPYGNYYIDSEGDVEIKLFGSNRGLLGSNSALLGYNHGFYSSNPALFGFISAPFDSNPALYEPDIDSPLEQMAADIQSRKEDAKSTGKTGIEPG
ncbi:hypothetical protein EJ06DRAFT_64745 [Trichodelitschia bisporula]|uniref:Uncharacterized protein n=1 Tax=Trichodelitschia bisporula TaxID=703511 RepID=A0A6G1HSE3_9PEZI|nr:hypothetical protein EJ06DRAFT_64745 [Trichodelitschia bisporula]